MAMSKANQFYVPEQQWNYVGSISSTSNTWTSGLAVAAAPPAKRSPLGWLDDEIERTCALARKAA